MDGSAAQPPTAAPETDGDDERRVFEQTFRLTTTVMVAMLLMALGAQLPDGWAPSWLATQRYTYRVVWPQGWSFFADASVQSTIVVYRVGPAGTYEEITFPHMSAANQWGLGRAASTQIVEARRLAAGLPARAWATCDRWPAKRPCLEAVGRLPPRDVDNLFARPTLCGRLIVTVERWLPPGVEREQRGQSRVVEQAARVDARCTSAGSQR
jgi:antimicrobial peptide system SdpA family protein